MRDLWMCGILANQSTDCVMTLHLVTVHTQGGYTALHTSSAYGHVDVVRALIAAKAHVNQQSKVI